MLQEQTNHRKFYNMNNEIDEILEEFPKVFPKAYDQSRKIFTTAHITKRKRYANEQAKVIDKQLKLSDDVLHQSEEKFRYLFEHSCIGKSITYPTGEIHVNNAFCKMIGYSLEELENRMWQDITYPEDIGPNQKAIDQLISGEKESIEFEKRYVHKDGRIVWTSIFSSLRRDNEGNPLYLMTNVIDITERKKAEANLHKAYEELKRSNKEFREFAYIVSHDLQEPLRTIYSFAQILEKENKGKLGPTGDEYIGYITSATKRMQQMINDILVLSRISNGKDFLPINVENIINIVIENLRNSIEKHNAIVTFDNPMPTILADKTQLIQLFQNLVANGIKFHRKGEPPKIHISSKKVHNERIFSVNDNGMGIDNKYFEKLFIIFSRLHSKEKYPGTGIGLAICKKIVECHNGKIWVESKVGEGSTFYFSIPI